MKQVPITDASPAELRAFAELKLGIDGISPAMNRNTLIARITPAWPHDYIEVEETEEQHGDAAPLAQAAPSMPEPQQRLKGGAGANDPKVRLKIATTSLPGGKHPVTVAVNGQTKVIQRNMVVDLPYRFYLALINAQVGDVSQDDATGEITATEHTNYPMTVILMPGEDEIAAWHARTDNQLMPA